jgi:hypothetical protein
MSTFSGQEAADLFQRYLKTISEESDRGAVLVGASLLDDALGKALKKKLVSATKNEDSLFDGGYSPLRSFAAKVELAFRLGLITRKTKQMLDTVRNLRNDFAHGTETIALNDEKVKNRIRAAYDQLSGIHQAIIGTFDEIIRAEHRPLTLEIFLETELGRRAILNVFLAANAMALRRVEIGIQGIVELKD